MLQNQHCIACDRLRLQARAKTLQVILSLRCAEHVMLRRCCGTRPADWNFRDGAMTRFLQRPLPAQNRRGFSAIFRGILPKYFTEPCQTRCLVSFFPAGNPRRGAQASRRQVSSSTTGSVGLRQGLTTNQPVVTRLFGFADDLFRAVEEPQLFLNPYPVGLPQMSRFQPGSGVSSSPFPLLHLLHATPHRPCLMPPPSNSLLRVPRAILNDRSKSSVSIKTTAVFYLLYLVSLL